jgi:hypothetical protein
VDSITPISGYKARFNRAVGDFVADAITIGDIIYVLGGPNSNTRWMVVALTEHEVQAMGSVLPQTAGATNIEVWPKTTESIPLALSYVASIEGSAREPFNPILGASDTVTLGINGTPATVVLTAGAQSAQQACTTINSQLAGLGFGGVVVAEPYLSPLRYDGIVDVSVSGITGTFTLQSGQLDGLGITAGDFLQILSGPNAGLVVPLTVVDGTPPVTFVRGDEAALVAATGVRIQIGPAGRKIRVRYQDALSALASVKTLSVGNDPLSVGASLLLGFPAGAVFTSRQTKAAELVRDFNSKMTRAQAARVLTPVTSAALGRSKPDSTGTVVLYKFRGQGAVTASPTTIVLDVEGGLLAAGVEVGDVLVLRSGADFNSTWEVTLVTDTSLTATSGITTTSSDTVDVEVGPALVSPTGRLLQITSGPNVGEYAVIGTGATPFDLLIDGALPIFKDGFTQPVFFSARLCTETIRVSSKNTTVTSRVTMNGAGAQSLSSVIPLVGSGTTTWFKPPSIPADLRAGDHLDIYLSDYRTPSESFELLLVDKAGGVVQLGHPISSVTTWTFGDQPPPFARLRSGRVFEYTVLQTQLTAWAALPVNKPAFFVELNRFLNPLLVNTNPTGVQLNDARSFLLTMVGVLSASGAVLTASPEDATLEAALEKYSVEPVPEVDTLFKTFKEKGSDRAIDLLTEGRFTSFFGLSLDSASYAGDMQEKMRLVARQDLPVRKVDRDDAHTSRQTAEVADVDYEYSKDDIDDVQIDPPVD